jgi:CRISPR system Cascade subunit CasE
MSAWLTQITPDYRNRQVYRDLRDATRMHKLVMSLVPDGLGEEARRQAGVLYRIEDPSNGARVLVQTTIEPDLSTLPAQYRNAQARDLSPLLGWLRQGGVIRYRLNANTCLRKARTKQVVPLRGADADAWWVNHAPGCGIALQSLMSRSPGDIVGGDNPRTAIRHTVTQFDGVAVVTDPTALTSAIITGIGRGKSHGCGLLSIAPIGNGGA